MSDTFDKDGYLFKRAGSTKKSSSTQKKWKAYYFNLIGGTLHYYAFPDDSEPKGSVELKGMTVIPDPPSQGSKTAYPFGIQGKGRELVLCAEEEAERKEWCEKIQANLTKDPAAPLKKEKRKVRGDTIAFKVKKNATQKAAATSLGKRAIRAQSPEEVRNLVRSLRNIIERESKSAKKATEVEEGIFKVGIKAFFLVEGGKITMEELLEADAPLRTALEMLAKCHDHAKYSREPNLKLLHEKFNEISQLLHKGATILTKLLGPHLKAKNVALIKSTVDYLAEPERLLAIFTDSALDEDLQELIGASEHYTQFHFYAEK